jgi:diguanylate cyclase (GGDEF)-like protein
MIYANQKELIQYNRAHWLGLIHRQAKCLYLMTQATRRYESLQSTKKRLCANGLRSEQVCFIDPRDCLQRGKLSVPLLMERLELEYRLGLSQGFQTCDINCDILSIHQLLPCTPYFLKNLINEFQKEQPCAFLIQVPKKGLAQNIFEAILDFGELVMTDGDIETHARSPKVATSLPTRPQEQSRPVSYAPKIRARITDQHGILFSLLDLHDSAFCLVDHQEQIIHWNTAFAKLTRLSMDNGTPAVAFRSVILPLTPLQVDAGPQGYKPQNVLGELKYPEGNTRQINMTIHHLADQVEQQSWVKLVMVHNDCLGACENDPFCKTKKQYKHIFELFRRGLARIAGDGTILYINRAFGNILKCEPLDILRLRGMRWWQSNCRAAEQYTKLFREILEKGVVSQFELEVLASDNSPRQLLVDAYMLSDGPDDPSFLAVFEDVTEYKEKEQQLLHQAFNDHLTGLPHKALLMDRVELAIHQGKRRKDAIFGLAFLDIDDFKRVNDTFGHVIGDQVLVHLAHRIMRSVRNVDTVARFGGDEFVILLNGILDEHEAELILNRVKKELAMPMPITEQEEIVCSVSIGLVLSSGYASAAEMLRDADRAMYNAKAKKNGRIQTLRLPAKTRPQQPQISPDDFFRSMNLEELLLLYQPIFRVSSGIVTGFEALLRWQHPKHGLLLPGEFFPLAAKYGHSDLLIHWLLKKACFQMRSWQMDHNCVPPLSICVNMSAVQLNDPGLFESIQSLLEATGLGGGSLQLEFSNKAISQSERTGEFLMRMKELDVRLTISDLGMRYATLLHLQKYPFLPIDNLKIDRCVVAGLTEHVDCQEMAWATITLAHSLGLEVVAEGVKTAAQLSLLADMNCNYVQGCLFSEPLESKSAGNFLSDRLHTPLFKIKNQRFNQPSLLRS